MVVHADELPDDAKQVEPITVGEKAPNPLLRMVDGNEVSLDAVRGDDPTIVVFYRGGWCPYCNRHLSELQTLKDEIKELGWKMVALSPDNPEHLQMTVKEQDLSYTLLSDSEMKAAKAFGVAFQVDGPTVERLEGFGIDLEKASGQSHRQLPVPAVFLVNSEGVVTFVFMDPNYKKRLSSDVLLKKLSI